VLPLHPNRSIIAPGEVDKAHRSTALDVAAEEGSRIDKSNRRSLDSYAAADCASSKMWWISVVPMIA
jgi:hypothetical protein